MKKLALFLFIICGISISSSYAQSQAKKDTTASSIEKSKQPTSKNSSTETLDTNESINYLGSSLWFQMKKRLNLTTVEEEKKEAESKKKKRVLTIAGIKIET
jgi:hypothetical protein